MSQPDYDAIAKELHAAGNALIKAGDLLAVPPPPVGAITTPAELDAALLTADPGATLVIAPTLRYLTPLALSKPVTLRNAALANGRATRATAMPSFQDGLIPNALDVRLFGLEVQKLDHLTDILVINGAGCTVDGCRILGDQTLGAKRGIAGNAPHVTVLRSFVDDCFQASPGNDSQAFAAWNSPGPFLLEDNYFSGGSETVLFGGADPSSAANVPTNIVIQGNTITKNPAWMGKAIGVKNTLELKNAIDVLIEDNDISYAWKQGQDGYLLVMTPRNQDGTAPYSTVKNVTIRQNRLLHGAGVMSMLGSDNLHPSGPLEGLIFEDNDCQDIDGPKYGNGNNKVFLALAGPKRVTIRGNKVTGPKAGSVLYFDVLPKCDKMIVTGNTFPTSEYGVMGAGSAPGGVNDDHGSAWTTFVQNGTLSGNSVA